MHSTSLPTSPRSLFAKKPADFNNDTLYPSRKDSSISTALKTDLGVPSLPHLSQFTKMDPSLTSEFAVTERIGTEIDLYKFHIPPDLINVLEPSERPTTIKILKTGNTIQTVVNLPKKESKVMPNGPIKRGDTLEKVRFILDQRIKEYERQKMKGKLKGSMYVNDLWGHGYEKGIIKATYIDKELNKEATHNRRPLGEKYQDLVTIYEKRGYNKKNVHFEKPSAPSSSRLQNKLHRMSTLSPGNIEDSKRLSKLMFPTTKPQLHYRIKSEFASVTERNLNSLNSIPDHGAIRERLRSEETIFRDEPLEPRAKKPNLKIQTNFNYIREMPEIRLSALDEFEEAGNPTGKPGYHQNFSRSALTARSISSKTSADWKSFQGIQFHKPKGSGFGAKTARSNRGDSARYFVSSPDMGSPHLRSPVSGKAFEESAGAFEDLIGMCNTELDEKSECLGMLSELGQMFDKRKGRRQKFAAKLQRDQIIEDCQNMVKKRENTNKKKLNGVF